MEPLTFRETAGRAHHALTQLAAREEASRAKTLQSELRKKLGEDEDTAAPNSSRTTPQSGKEKEKTMVCQASGSSPGQPAPYSQEEWAQMQKAYDLGRECEREYERQEGERRGEGRTADGAEDMRGYADPNTRGAAREAYPNRQGDGGSMPRRGVRAVNTPWVFIDEGEARRAGYCYTVPL